MLFFCITDLAKVDTMYLNSLQFFARLFEQVLQDKESPRSSVPVKRVEQLVERLTDVAFQSVCRGLFEKDKLLFAFLVALRLSERSRVALPHEIGLLLRGAGVTDRKGYPAPPTVLVAAARAEEDDDVEVSPTHAGASPRMREVPAVNSAAWDLLIQLERQS